MRWPWQRAPQPVEPPPCACTDDDAQGLAEAHEALDRALSNWPEVTTVSETIRGIRRRNHLAEQISEAWGGAHRR